MSSTELPLFPLRTVLFPGGRLRLRLFEPRYLDMVKQCTRNDSGFGVCLILDGNEAGAPATPAAFGTRARIVDFYSQPDGLLGLQVSGESRFHVLRTRIRDNGLIVANVETLDEAPPQPVAPEHGLLATRAAHRAFRRRPCAGRARLLRRLGVGRLSPCGDAAVLGPRAAGIPAMR